MLDGNSLAFFVNPLQLRSDEITVGHAHRIIADDLIMAFAAAVVVFLYDRERSRFLSYKSARHPRHEFV